jgi:hypothetical protein
MVNNIDPNRWDGRPESFHTGVVVSYRGRLASILSVKLRGIAAPHVRLRFLKGGGGDGPISYRLLNVPK